MSNDYKISEGTVADLELAITGGTLQNVCGTTMYKITVTYITRLRSKASQTTVDIMLSKFCVLAPQYIQMYKV